MRSRTIDEHTISESFHAESPQSGMTGRPVVLDIDRRRSVVAEDPGRAFRSMLRRWRLLAVCAVLGSLAGFVTGAAADEVPVVAQMDHYQASHILFLDNNVPATQSVLSVRNLNTVAKRVTIGRVPAAVAAGVGIAPEDAAQQVRVIIRSDSGSLDIVTVSENAVGAEQLADAFADELLAVLAEEASDFAAEAVASAQARLDEAEANLATVRVELEDAREQEDARRIALLEQDEQQFLSARVFANAALLEARADGVPVVPLETLRDADNSAVVITQGRFESMLDRAAAGQNVVTLHGDETESGGEGGALSAVGATLPSGPLPRALVGAVLGLLGGFVVLVFLNRIDVRVRSKRQVEDALDLPVIAEVPAVGHRSLERGDLHAVLSPRGRFAEQHRALVSTIAYARRSRAATRGQVVLVTSPGPAEGKTTTVANIGAMAAESGRSVLLINCDFRRPRLHLHFDTSSEPMKIHSTSVDGVDLISNVVANADAAPAEVIAEQLSTIEQARKVYDLILIDTAPILATNDAVDLVGSVDDILLVLRSGKTSIHAADRAAELLERRRCHILGITLTAVDARSSDDYYQYGYYGTYYSDARREPSVPASTRERTEASESVPVDADADVDTTNNHDAEHRSAVAAASEALRREGALRRQSEQQKRLSEEKTKQRQRDLDLDQSADLASRLRGVVSEAGGRQDSGEPE